MAKYKVLQHLAGDGWVIKKDQILDGDKYPECEKWAKRGLAVEVLDNEIETASLSNVPQETATAKRKAKVNQPAQS